MVVYTKFSKSFRELKLAKYFFKVKKKIAKNHGIEFDGEEVLLDMDYQATFMFFLKTNIPFLYRCLYGGVLSRWTSLTAKDII